MSVVKELLRTETDGTISFGNYELQAKSKLSDYEHDGDMYKVKTFYEITKLEKNGMFVYESVPGTAVFHMNQHGQGIEFEVSGKEHVQITVELEGDTEYLVVVDGEKAGYMQTNLGGKLSFSVDLNEAKNVAVEVKKL